MLRVFKKRMYATHFFLPLLALLTLFFSPLVYSACTITDDAGVTLELARPAQRIISLAPDITETLFAIGAGHRVVGVVRGSDYPLTARTIPLIGSYMGIDIERILALHPDLIVTWSNTFFRQLQVLRKFGIAVYTTQPRHLEDVPRAMRNLGCLTGLEHAANYVADNFSAQLAQIREHYETQKPVTVFYQIGAYSLLTINKESWINQVIVLCGGRNVFAEATFITPEVDWEAIIAQNPQAVLNGAVDDKWKKRWIERSELSAVKSQSLFTVNPDWIERAGPRLLKGILQICHQLQSVRSPTA